MGNSPPAPPDGKEGRAECGDINFPLEIPGLNV